VRERRGVLRNREPETFIVETIDENNGQTILRLSFHSESELRARFKSLPDEEFEALLAEIRTHPMD
jgi:hypothetical protein